MERRAGTGRKQVRLTVQGEEAIREYAESQGISFSSAIESLALMGLGKPELAMFPLFLSGVRGEIQRQAHRISALMAAAAVESGVAARMAGALVSDRYGRERYEEARTRARLQAVESVRRREGLEELIGGRVREGSVPEGGGGQR